MTGEIIIFSFTRAGTELNRRLCRRLCGEKRQCRGYAPEKFAGDGISPFPEEIREFIGRSWGRAAFIFVGAAGIAVRYIAPFVRDKFTDSAVLVLDEKGRYVIPLLSGHVGGAVQTADEIAEMFGAETVHTTATDVQQKFAVDVFAKKIICISQTGGWRRKYRQQCWRASGSHFARNIPDAGSKESFRKNLCCAAAGKQLLHSGTGS